MSFNVRVLLFENPCEGAHFYELKISLGYYTLERIKKNGVCAHTKHLSTTKKSTHFNYYFVQISAFARKTRIVSYQQLLRFHTSTVSCFFKVRFKMIVVQHNRRRDDVCIGCLAERQNGCSEYGRKTHTRTHKLKNKTCACNGLTCAQ